MRKIVGLVIVLNLLVLSFAGVFEEYLNLFDINQGMKNEKIDTLAYQLNYLQTGYKISLEKSQELFAQKNSQMNKDEIALLKAMYTFDPFTYLKPEKEIEKLLKEYPDSLIIKGILCDFYFKDWVNSKDPEIAKKMLNLTKDIITKNEFVLTYYYQSRLFHESNLFENKDEAMNLIEKAYNINSNNKLVIEELIKLHFEKNNYDKVEQFGDRYFSFEETNPKTLLLVMKGLVFLKKYDKIKPIADYIIKNTDAGNLLSKTYEILATSTENLNQKIDYYEKVVLYNDKNGKAWGELGMLYLKQDPQKNKDVARLCFNKALLFYPDQPEVKQKLDALRFEIKFGVIIQVVVPILAFVALGIIIIIYIEKKKNLEEQSEVTDTAHVHKVIKVFEENKKSINAKN